MPPASRPPLSRLTHCLAARALLQTPAAAKFQPAALPAAVRYYDSYFRCATFSADMGLVKLDLGRAAGEQPIVLDMAKTTDTGEYLWKFEVT